MKRKWITLRSAWRALATVLVVAAAAVVFNFLPVQTQIMGPFDVHGAFGETVTGRAIAVTVHGVRVTPTVTSVSLGRAGQRIAATGKWVVVDATLELVRDFAMPRAELLVDGDTYVPSERFLAENLNAAGLMGPGIPERGVWAFDVATDLLDANSRAPLVLQVWADDGRLDSRLVIAIDRHDLSRQDVVALTAPRMGR